jgi:hypothetical protein
MMRNSPTVTERDSTERNSTEQYSTEREEFMRSLAAVLAFILALATPVLAQHLPHGAQEFFTPEQKATPRVTPFAPNPADIFYENPAVQVSRDLPAEP